MTSFKIRLGVSAYYPQIDIPGWTTRSKVLAARKTHCYAPRSYARVARAFRVFQKEPFVSRGLLEFHLDRNARLRYVCTYWWISGYYLSCKHNSCAIDVTTNECFCQENFVNHEWSLVTIILVLSLYICCQRCLIFLSNIEADMHSALIIHSMYTLSNFHCYIGLRLRG